MDGNLSAYGQNNLHTAMFSFLFPAAAPPNYPYVTPLSPPCPQWRVEVQTTIPCNPPGPYHSTKTMSEVWFQTTLLLSNNYSPHFNFSYLPYICSAGYITALFSYSVLLGIFLV